MNRFAACFVAFAILAIAHSSGAAEKVRVLIIDGQNNHNWAAMTPPMKAELEKTGRFTVEVATTPSKGAPEGDWEKFRPDFSRCDVVLSNYNGQMWPETVRESFVKFVEGGGGVVIIHAANNAFSEWDEYNLMIGLGWRNNKFGERLYLDDGGELVRVGAGEGLGAGHGAQHEFQITLRDEMHPVVKGMPKVWMHARDELYHGQRGPAENMRLVATAYSRDTKVHEPMIWWVPYGKGRVFTTVMGHVGGAKDRSIKCIGFITVMNRACEWAATGEVTLPVPDDFPTEDAVSVRED